jgi:hypothetical protein
MLGNPAEREVTIVIKEPPLLYPAPQRDVLRGLRLLAQPLGDRPGFVVSPKHMLARLATCKGPKESVGTIARCISLRGPDGVVYFTAAEASTVP